MNRAPPGVDLSFLNEEEAKQIFQVLERDTQLKRAEKERISKLHKIKKDATEHPGVTGEWFEEMQRRKFQTDANAGRMLKQPLAHRLRKALRNDSTSAKPAPLQVPQAQKNASPSLLGGLRTPFASLFSSFRKPKRQPPKPPPQEQQCPTRYDHFALAAHPSSKVEEMAKTETGDSPSPFEPTNKGCDSTKVEVEENMSTWNEQLENELLRVLGNLDDQLAREQAQDSVNRKTPTDYGSRAPDTNQHSTITRPTFLGRVQRNDRSMFLSDGTRTLRAREEHKTPVRPRMFYDTYFKRHHAEDYAYWDVGSGSTTLKRGHSTRSLGQCSEGSLGYSSATPSNGFGHKDFMYTDNVSRSYSLSCLARRQSLGSADQLSIVGLQHPSAMEGNGRFTQRNCRLYPRRTPLSSVVWNAPQSSEHPQYPESLLRTRSLMEFGPAVEDTYPCAQSGSVGSGDAKEGTFEPVSQQIDSNSPTEPSIAPSKNSSVTVPQNNVLLKPPLPSGSERQAKSTSKREIEKMHSSSIRNRNGQQNEGDCATNYCDQMSLPPSVTGNCTRAPIPQSLQQEEHQSESLRALGHNKKCKNISAPDSSRGPEIFTDEQLPEPCTEKFSRRNSFVRHATTTKITGSPSNSPPKSPMIYYNLPRKSASIDGSVLLEKPMSSAKRPIKNLIAMGNNFDRHISNRLENLYSNRDKLSCVSPASSSLNPSPKENTPQIRDCHLLSTQDPRHRSTTDVISSKSGKGTMIGSPEKSEAPVFSDCEETDEGNPLQQYKTTSKLTVSIEEDNVQYHELISVYYTLPRKQSRTLCSLFLDDTKNTDSSLPLENYRAPQKKYEVRIGLASVAFPSSLEREEKAGSPGKMPVTHGMPQNSEIPDDPDKGGPDVISPTTERASASQAQSTMYHRGGLGVQTEAPVLVRSNRIALNDPLSELKPRVTVNESVNIITNALGKLHIGTCPSPLKESSERDNTLSFSSSNPTDPKIPLENVAAASFAMDAQKESLLCCQPSAKATKSNKLHILPSRSIGSNQEGKYAANPATDILENSAGEKTRQNAEVKERARYICHIISKKGNGLQPRNKSIRSGLDEAVISETKVCSDFQKQTFQLDAASKVNLALQTNIPERIALKHSKTEQEETPQNSLTYEDCTHLQSFEKNSVDNQNVNSKDQFSSTTQDLLNRSATENKLILDCMKDKASDIEKRKNRPSIKNKLAAMYKTSRKFSSKKSLSPKPHINSIFSQNGAPSLEISESHGMLISPDVPQSLLQTGNENQNLNPLPDELDNIVLDQLENKKSQINEGPLLVTNESRRPFANLCNQKRETGSVRQSDKKTINSPQNLTALFPEEIVSTLNISQARIKALENNNRSVFSRITAADLGQKKKDISNVSESSFSQHSPDKISNLLMKNDSKSNIYQPQKVVSPTGYNHDQNIKQSNRLNRNLPCVEPVVNLGKMQRERHFSETSYAREPLDHQASGSNFIRHNSRYGRKFKSYSELLSCDENENWEPYNDSNRTFGSRRVMYPSIEFGIFGKEQQQAFLDNIKRSLTEGRLWRPCLLKNPGCLRKEESGSLNMSEQLTSSFAERNASAEGSSLSEPTDVHGKGPVDYSDSDSDTTTDDEYYLDDGDKESEL